MSCILLPHSERTVGELRLAFSFQGRKYLSSAIEQERVRLRDSILTNTSSARIAEKTLLISRLGAKNDGKTDCRAAFAKAIRKASASKGAKIVVPAVPIILRDLSCWPAMSVSNCRRAPH